MAASSSSPKSRRRTSITAHTIFGEVTKGLDIAKAIARVPRDARDKPMENVVLKKVRIIEK